MRILTIFLVLGATAMCGLVNEGLLFKEERSIGSLPANYKHKVTAYPGVKFRINLPSNPSTGYGWELKGMEKLKKKMKLYFSTNTGLYIDPCKIVIGKAGNQEFAFKAKHAGVYVLVFWYKRSFEPERLFKYEVVVKVPEKKCHVHRHYHGKHF